MNQSDISESDINATDDLTVIVSDSSKCLSPTSPDLFDRSENDVAELMNQMISPGSSDFIESGKQSETKRKRGRPPRRKQFTMIADPIVKDCEGSDNRKQTSSEGVHKCALPKSPYFLVQEVLQHYPWKLLVATILLDNTAAHQKVVPVLWKVLNHWPTPEAASQADIHHVASYIFPIGHNYEKAEAIINFSNDFLTKDWTYPIELQGIGKYGDDCYRIFYLNEWFQVEPTDKMLQRYCQWLKSNCDHFGLTFDK